MTVFSDYGFSIRDNDAIPDETLFEWRSNIDPRFGWTFRVANEDLEDVDDDAKLTWLVVSTLASRLNDEARRQAVRDGHTFGKPEEDE